MENRNFNKDHYDEQYQLVMSAIDNFMNDPNISENNKKSSAIEMIILAVQQSTTTLLESVGMFEYAKDKFKDKNDFKDFNPKMN